MGGDCDSDSDSDAMTLPSWNERPTAAVLV